MFSQTVPRQHVSDLTQRRENTLDDGIYSLMICCDNVQNAGGFCCDGLMPVSHLLVWEAGRSCTAFWQLLIGRDAVEAF